MGQRKIPDRSELPVEHAPSQADLLLTQAELRDSAGKLAITDLHGLNEQDAKYEVDRFLNRLFMSGERVGKIIHGKGTGKLAKVVREVLEEEKQQGLLEAYGPPRSSGEFGSSVLVVVSEKE